MRVCKVKAYRDDKLYDVIYIATEDLGLPYLYDADTKTVAEGEGVWLVRGSYNSNPSAATHESVIYKDANERRTFIDAQGMITDTTCEAWVS